MTFLRTPALLIARIILGVIFIAHGWQKFTNGLDATAQGFDGMGVPAPKLSAFFTTWLELIGGVALILGVLLPLFGTLLALTMFGAAYFAHWDNGFWAGDKGYEYVIALAAGVLAVGFANAGVVSIDHYLFRRVGRRDSTVVVEEG
ncbi:hypothetical protein GOARA_012_00840 [Gordonia araii NBRC 100433]|uniref:DoxX family protein n=1 Tax=Gordonia araii NBRC 100433 TaxID=1073574 RepID=G7GY59_9ACTN|nr:DoxX family protein [Gordonia araii]NNG98142.1 DoxX family protein [Gordonia araii NBRC 100433]GAB08534.1 hypothetical protein GOARA_012_00840 [Gordonia araii NBRC 100433]